MSKNGPAIAGLVLGVIAALLVKFGNPGNMGFCVACFTRDIAGAFGLHRAAIVQYLRPEIAGFILGAFASALAFSEYRPRGGSSPMVRFALGFFAMIGALVFLGCPWRATCVLRAATGTPLPVSRDLSPVSVSASGSSTVVSASVPRAPRRRRRDL